MSKQLSKGAINYTASNRKTDYLYRVSIKGLVRNEAGKILVVKENGRNYWDIPGGGMDHNESIKQAVAREMKEEVGLSRDFTYRVIAVDDPDYLAPHDLWQVRLILNVVPDDLVFYAGEDGDEIAFIDPETFKESISEVERRIYAYSQLL